jgi:hypothetical protein
MPDRYDHCKISFDETTLHEDTEDGLVVINGPRAALWAWGEDEGRYVQVDTLTAVEVKNNPEGFVLSGRSDLLLRQVGVERDNSRLQITVKTRKRCSNC